MKLARSDKLRHAPKEIFSGEVYLAEEARRYGLIDGIGRLKPVLKARFGEDVRLVSVKPRRGWLGRFGGASASTAAALSMSDGGSSVGSSIAAAGADGLIDTLETRALWARYGL